MERLVDTKAYIDPGGRLSLNLRSGYSAVQRLDRLRVFESPPQVADYQPSISVVLPCDIDSCRLPAVGFGTVHRQDL